MIYLDHHSASPLRPGVIDVMAQAARIGGNPSSVHQLGRAARRTLHVAQGHLQRLVGADTAPTDVVFCGSLAEARSLSILGIAHALRVRSKRQAVVLDESLWALCPGLISQLCLDGYVVGQLSFGQPDTGFRIRRYSLGAQPWEHGLSPIATDEIGVLAVSALGVDGQLAPWALISKMTQDYDLSLVVDAGVAAGRVALHMHAYQAAAICIASPPLGGPAGIAAVVFRKGVDAQPLWQGGGQNLGRRSGTEATVLAAGMGAAAHHAHAHHDQERHRFSTFREALCDGTSRLVQPPDCPDLILWPQAAAAVTSCVGPFDREGVMVGWAAGVPGKHSAFVRLTMGHNTTAQHIQAARAVLHRFLHQHKEDRCA